MRLIPHDQIKIEDRIRQDFSRKELDDLKRSVHQKGLWHPPVLSHELKLLAGERRLKVMCELHEEGNEFYCDGEKVPTGQIPYTFVQDLSPADFIEAELEENILRSELSWQEQTSARVRIHELRKEQNPGWLQSETAAEIAEIKGTSPKVEQSKLARALILEQHKEDPRVQNAPNESAAYRAVLDRGNAKFRAQLAKLQGYESPHEVICGDAFEVLKTFPDKFYDTILFDPPYGIDADKMGKGATHHYQDDPEYAMRFSKFVITEGFRICKPQAIMFMFCDMDFFRELKEYAQMQAWTVWRTPLIWDKGDTDGGSAPWGRYGPKRTYEILMLMVKGGQELRNPGGRDILGPYRRVAKSEKLHAAEKPIELLEHLVSLSCLPGATLLDPCAGSGSIIPAADKHKVRVTAIELDSSYHAAALERANAGSPDEDELDEEDASGLDQPGGATRRSSLEDLLGTPTLAVEERDE